MAEADGGASVESPAQFTPLTAVRWEAYSVTVAGKEVGYVACLPEGLWFAYRDDGKLPGRYGTRAEAAAALAGGVALAANAPARATSAQLSGAGE